MSLTSTHPPKCGCVVPCVQVTLCEVGGGVHGGELSVSRKMGFVPLPSLGVRLYCWEARCMFHFCVAITGRGGKLISPGLSRKILWFVLGWLGRVFLSSMRQSRLRSLLSDKLSSLTLFQDLFFISFFSTGDVPVTLVSRLIRCFKLNRWKTLKSYG